MSFKSVKTLLVNNKHVLLRADLNVPVQGQNVTDTTRIDRLKPTIDYLVNAGAKVSILSHFGRPEGIATPDFSLNFLLPTLTVRWGVDVSFSTHCIGDMRQTALSQMLPGQVMVLENVRFHPGEKKNDPEFAKSLAQGMDYFVNDAFSTAHRAHASTVGITAFLPCAAGLLMEAELTALDRALGNPEKPVAALAGGSKISTKLTVLHNLVTNVDYLILGGAMANTFLHAKGANVGSSMCETDMKEDALRIIKTADKHGCEIILPQDSIIVTDLKAGADHKAIDSMNIPDGSMAIDIGPKTIETIKNALQKSRTLVWNGPMGVFEIMPFDHGTNQVAKIAAELTRTGQLQTIAGGGDTAAALENAEVIDDFSYISTAGGAFLEWLEGKTLPGVAALENSVKAA